MIGQIVSHYRIIESLGEGGMGVVYQAEDMKLGRRVALKFLRSPLPEGRARLLTEAEAAAALNHPNICTIYEVDDEHPFIAMELVEGETLAQKINRRPLPLREALNIAGQAGQALQAAHERQITHRDIKSSNIIVTPSGQVKVLDFGLALMAEHTRVTSTGALLGTPSYMSPEQAKGEPVDRRTDIWSLGVVLYEMVTAQLPFRGETPGAVLHSILNDRPERLTALRGGLPVELDRIVGKALRKDPSERYQHLDEMLVDLTALTKESREERLDVAASPAPARSKRTVRQYSYLAAVAIIILLVAAAWYGYWGNRSTRQAVAAAIAVLPLDDLSGDSSPEYFSDGMTDALISELGTIGGLRVISRTSVMRFKRSGEPLSKIAAQLNVDHVLEGTVLESENRVRVSARLIRVDRDQQVWAKTYERDLKDVLALQREVAQAVATEIGSRFSPGSAAATRGVHPEAYKAYLQGLQYFNSPSGRDRAIEHFQRAVDLDSRFALAYGALARCYAVGGGGPEMSRMEIRRRAVDSATRALELDEATAEAHNALGWVKVYFDYDWQGAARAYQRALELSPSLSDAHHRYSHYLIIMGRFQAGLEASRRALELDPFDRRIVGHYVWALFMTGRYDEARRYCQSVLDADPDNFNARGYSYRVYEHFGEYQRILGEKPSLVRKTVLARAYALSGSKERSRQLLREALPEAEQGDNQYDIALVHLALGENATAMEWLEKAFERRGYPLPEMSVDPRFDPLRKESAFQALLERMGLKAEAR